MEQHSTDYAAGKALCEHLGDHADLDTLATYLDDGERTHAIAWLRYEYRDTLAEVDDAEAFLGGVIDGLGTAGVLTPSTLEDAERWGAVS